ncbi:MAG TPA: peptidylprolyl isomerase [Anaeromyxobacter sp.]|nr:peptidylprolyl isomerase [Anaeromyxobacter sp.]
MTRTGIAIALSVALAAPLAGAQAPAQPAQKEKKMTAEYATFKTSLGDIVVKLLPEKAPKTVENFVGLAEGKKEWKDPRTGQMVKKPLYDGTVFHRVIPRFMIQGGDPLGTGTGGPGYKFADEIGPDNSFDRPGLLAMANAGPNTNGSQFFITEVPTPHLNRGHTIFGEVVKGQELIAKIAAAGNAKVKLEKVVISRGAQP